MMLPFLHYSFVYCIGIGGIGMSALARLFAAQGYKVFGYDRARSPLVHQLQKEGIPIQCDDSVCMIPAVIRTHPDKTIVIYTPAISRDNPILHYFQNAGYTIISRAEALGLIAKNLPTVAIAGTHGKTTTAAMIAHMFCQSSIPMLAFVGGIVRLYNSNIIHNLSLNQIQLCIAEADEFNRSFLQLTPTYSIVTAVDSDHLDTYPTLHSMEESFRQFINQSKQKVWIHAKAAEQLQGSTYPHTPFLTYALDRGSIQADHVRLFPHQSIFDYIGNDLIIKKIVLPIPGLYNIENALAAITVGLTVGLTEEHIRTTMASFPGIHRRFAYVFQNEKFALIDDYAHHPVEVQSLLTAVRSNYPNSCITAIFQPHLFSRTAIFYEAFAVSLNIADQVFLLPVYPAREMPLPGITSQLIFDSLLCSTKLLVMPDELLIALPHYLLQQQHHVILTIGAGDIGEMTAAVATVVKDQLM